MAKTTPGLLYDQSSLCELTWGYELTMKKVFCLRTGLWNQGVYSHFCDTRESPPVYGVLVFGVRPFLLYHRSGFHFPQPCLRIPELSKTKMQIRSTEPMGGSLMPAATESMHERKMDQLQPEYHQHPTASKTWHPDDFRFFVIFSIWQREECLL